MRAASDGYRDASATPHISVAPQGVSKSQGSLCSPLLLGVANYECDCSCPRQTQVASEDNKRRKIVGKCTQLSGTQMSNACEWETCITQDIGQHSNASGFHPQLTEQQLDLGASESSLPSCTAIVY